LSLTANKRRGRGLESGGGPGPADAVVALSQETKSILVSDETQVLLGAEVFRRYRMTKNLPTKHVLFEETAETRSRRKPEGLTTV
jgi:hypothetical protein